MRSACCVWFFARTGSKPSRPKIWRSSIGNPVPLFNEGLRISALPRAVTLRSRGVDLLSVGDDISASRSGRMDAGDVHADTVHVLAGRDVERAAIAIAECDVRGTDLCARLAGRHG